MNKLLKKRSFGPVSLLVAMALSLAACGGSSTSGSGSTDPFDPANFNPSWLSANVNGGTPSASQMGGIVKIEGSTDLSYGADPQAEYETVGYTVERLYARQLVSYASSSNPTTSETIVPDAASALPDITNGGKTYTFHLRSGIMWNTSTPRAVTSQDFVRGLKRMCDPTISPNNNVGYYEATIAGFTSYCTPFTHADAGESAAARAAYINGNDISGVTTPDSSTVVINLTQPASDFLNIMAMPFTSAAPVEYLSQIPLSGGFTLLSDGPYQISNYNVGHELDFNKNPAWKSSSDPIRKQYVDGFNVKLDLSPATDATQTQQDMKTGVDDFAWNTVVPTSDIAGLSNPHDPNFGAFPSPGITNPYLVFNTMSPNNTGALGKVKVRQALEYAVDKVAINKIYGGADLNEPLNQVLGPGAQGYQPFNDYATPKSEGDAAKCKSMLADAGYPNGLTLTDYYRASGNHPAVYQSLLSDFAKCGVTVKGVSIASNYYGPTGIGTAQLSDLTKGQWDITEPGWNPDWYGPENARAIVPPLFQLGPDGTQGSDWGGYNNPAVNKLISQALSASSASDAANLWHQVDQKIMADAPFIPLQTQLTALYHSSRVHNDFYSPFASQYDLAQVWLSS